MQKYILPVITALLLLIFFLGMPELDRVDLQCRRARIGRRDAIVMAVFVSVFGFVSFSGLGSTTAPETFVCMNNRQSVIELAESAEISEIGLYSGVGYGTYTLDYYDDTGAYIEGYIFTQEAGSVLRWNYIYPDYGSIGPIKTIRISGSGDAYLGEISVYSIDGSLQQTQVRLSGSIPELCDEQEKACPEYNFMNSSYFDEIYHARTAWENLNRVYPYEISHPPLGKLIISIGIAIFGMTPFGWRFSGTLFGVLMLPLMFIIIKKMFGSRRCAVAGTLVFATDFMRFVQTRIATIDVYAVFFILLMYLFMYIYVTEEKLWALALSGVTFGLGAASKWTCIYAGAGLAVIWVIHRIRHREDGFGRFIKNALFCVVFFILVPCFIYYLSYIPYGTAKGIVPVFSREYLDIVLSNQRYMFSYHSSLVATHPYSSRWYQWILDIRPILYYLKYDGDLRSSFGAFVNPVLCWGGLLSLFVLLYTAAFRRNRNAQFIIIGYLAQLLPWVFVTRLTFEYHYFPCTVFLVLAVSYIFALMEKRKQRSRTYIWGFSLLSLLIFILFYPALSGLKVNNAHASALLQWLPTWPF